MKKGAEYSKGNNSCTKLTDVPCKIRDVRRAVELIIEN